MLKLGVISNVLVSHFETGLFTCEVDYVRVKTHECQLGGSSGEEGEVCID